jgi:hypothetical protein
MRSGQVGFRPHATLDMYHLARPPKYDLDLVYAKEHAGGGLVQQYTAAVMPGRYIGLPDGPSKFDSSGKPMSIWNGFRLQLIYCGRLESWRFFVLMKGEEISAQVLP